MNYIEIFTLTFDLGPNQIQNINTIYSYPTVQIFIKGFTYELNDNQLHNHIFNADWSTISLTSTNY